MGVVCLYGCGRGHKRWAGPGGRRRGSFVGVARSDRRGLQPRAESCQVAWRELVVGWAWPADLGVASRQRRGQTDEIDGRGLVRHVRLDGRGLWAGAWFLSSATYRRLDGPAVTRALAWSPGGGRAGLDRQSRLCPGPDPPVASSPATDLPATAKARGLGPICSPGLPRALTVLRLRLCPSSQARAGSA